MTERKYPGWDLDPDPLHVEPDPPRPALPTAASPFFLFALVLILLASLGIASLVLGAVPRRAPSASPPAAVMGLPGAPLGASVGRPGRSGSRPASIPLSGAPYSGSGSAGPRTARTSFVPPMRDEGDGNQVKREGLRTLEHPATSLLSGWATWYDDGPGLYGAAGPALRRELGKGWRGDRVQVCASSRCVVVVLSDWCACGRRRGVPTLIDLSPAAFGRIAPLSAGVVRVTIGGVSSDPKPPEAIPTGPPTDVAR